MLERLRTTIRRPPGASRDEEVAVQARDLIDLLRLHIRKEEIVLSVAERVLTSREIEALESRLSAHFETHTRPDRPDATSGGLL
jgi:hemerythrin-like domain-containing protein